MPRRANRRLIAAAALAAALALFAPACASTDSTTTTLDADGPGDTYELINSVLATTGSAIETPDCEHASFGEHITEVYDEDLDEYVFAFHLHLDEDSDRCVAYDRQRTEIKTYSGSPDQLKGADGETVHYRHKMKLDAGFLASNRFTHVFQLKAVGNDPVESDLPLITLTPRFGQPDRLQLIHIASSTSGASILEEVDLEPFLGSWVAISQTVVYGETGSYELVITDIETGTTLVSYTNSSLRMWRDGATFVRPKWGIYRSLQGNVQLRDEIVYFANFVITELPELPAAGG